MVEEQLIARGISDPKVLAAFRKVPRHEFVPPELWDSAYNDHPLPIGSGQTISQPYMVALMTECLKLKGPEKVLEIGTGSGYQLAILLEIVEEAYSIERIGPLAERADVTLRRLGYGNFKIVAGDGTMGLEEYKPYDGIMVTAAAPKIPASLVAQLEEGGRLVIPVGSAFSQILMVVEKRGGAVRQSEVCGCVFVPLVGKDGWRE
jgi:protein-L-isoaspartate(D-aspartate) O-methyltransferase